MPVQIELTDGTSPNPICVRDHQPGCVAAIGLIAIAWTRVEHEINSTISGILRINTGNTPGSGVSADWVISTTMQAISMSNARVTVVDKILRALLPNSSLLPKWDELYKRLKATAHLRNLIVHTGWVWSAGNPDGVILLNKTAPHALWVEKDFLDAFDAIKAVEKELHELMISIQHAVDDGSLKSRF